jgi:hypothetical protein
MAAAATPPDCGRSVIVCTDIPVLCHGIIIIIIVIVIVVVVVVVREYKSEC